MRKLVLFLVSLLFAAENAAAQVPDIGQKKDKPQLSLTDTVKNIDRGDGTETKPEDEDFSSGSLQRVEWKYIES